MASHWAPVMVVVVAMQNLLSIMTQVRSRPSTDQFTVTLTAGDGMPFATTSSELAPVSIVAGTSNLVETIALPVATPIVLWPGVENMSGPGVGNAHQRVVRGGLKLVAKRGSLRQAIELRAGDMVRGAAHYDRRITGDGRSPSR